MQCCIILFIIVNAVYVSSGFSAHHQELKSVHAASGICQTCLLLPLAWMSWDWFACATLYNTLYYCQRSTCFERFFRSSSGAQICTCSISYLSNLCAVTASYASGNSKQVWQMPDAACTDLSSWWWAEKPLETRTALKVTKSVIQRCILLFMLKNRINFVKLRNLKGTSCSTKGAVANLHSS
jgi:hypothetical protein